MQDCNTYNLDTAFNIVREKLAAVDIAVQCRKSGAKYSPDNVAIDYLNHNYRINISTAEVSLADSDQSVPLREQILILHYFTQAKGTPLTGRQITYRDLPGGLVYYPTFTKRTIEPLTGCFGKDAMNLLRAGKLFKARQGEFGNISLVIDAFPRVPVTVILWEGDDELAPQVNLLFDAVITDYLESEDVTTVCEAITWQLIKYTKKG
ncbi:MAG: DUF3786 domain-containing protein [Dehalococcoidales bacterium]|nr:DUF3786 domain-containing protein [Dehalococcoidales bacterium]